MSHGAKGIEDALKTVFPYAVRLHNFTKTCYDRHLENELSCPIDSRRLALEATKGYSRKSACSINDHLVVLEDRRMKQIVLDSREYFIERLRERVSQKCPSHFEGLLEAFRERFEKFHMIKYDPAPIINGWIGRWMLEPLPIGFSRLSLYLQRPCETHFKNFSCGTMPKPLDLPIDSPEMRSFVIELAVSSLRIPIK